MGLLLSRVPERAARDDGCQAALDSVFLALVVVLVVEVEADFASLEDESLLAP
jgi:hypothetical protein